MRQLFPVLLGLLILLLSPSCSGDGGGINLFSVEDDVRLGQQLNEEILSQPQDFPVLDRQRYRQQYAYVEGIVREILTSDDVRYKEEFPWEVYLIEGETLNAFASPGGYIYVYTGLIKFLDEKDDLVGVIAHEMAHADRRHSTEQLTKTYGIAFLVDFVLGGDQSIATQILGSLLSLQFSRDDEREADEYSVGYLCDTEYAANATASFFQKLVNEGGDGSPPEFLSTHPSPANRVSDITQLAEERGCDMTFNSNDQQWRQFQASLP